MDSRETRVAIIGIIVEKAGEAERSVKSEKSEKSESIAELNAILHEYGEYIIGRMGIPCRELGINVISVAVNAPQEIISAMSGRIGRLDGVSAKAAYSKMTFGENYNDSEK